MVDIKSLFSKFGVTQLTCSDVASEPLFSEADCFPVRFLPEEHAVCVHRRGDWNYHKAVISHLGDNVAWQEENCADMTYDA